MNCFGLIKFVTGILLALALLFVGGAAAARYLITRLTTLPPKPIFVEEQTVQETESSPVDDMAAAGPLVIDEDAVVFDDLEPESFQDSTTDVAATDEAAEAETPEPAVTEPGVMASEGTEPDSAEPESQEAETPEPEQANARVTQPIGMVLRQGPSQDTTRIGGLYYNDEIIVIGESADGQWQQVRLPGSGVEGWIKSGNTTPLD